MSGSFSLSEYLDRRSTSLWQGKKLIRKTLQWISATSNILDDYLGFRTQDLPRGDPEVAADCVGSVVLAGHISIPLILFEFAYIRAQEDLVDPFVASYGSVTTNAAALIPEADEVEEGGPEVDRCE